MMSDMYGIKYNVFFHNPPFHFGLCCYMSGALPLAFLIQHIGLKDRPVKAQGVAKRNPVNQINIFQS